MNKRIEKIVKRLQDKVKNCHSVRRDQIKKAIIEGGFDYFIYRGYDEVYDVEPIKLEADIENIKDYYLDNGDMWAVIDKDENLLIVTIKYGYSYMKLYKSLIETTEEVSPIQVENVEFTMEESVHTKTGETIYLVKLTQKVSKDEFNAIRDKIKKLGGYYSRFVSAFVFKSEESAKALITPVCDVVEEVATTQIVDIPTLEEVQEEVKTMSIEDVKEKISLLEEKINSISAEKKFDLYDIINYLKYSYASMIEIEEEKKYQARIKAEKEAREKFYSEKIEVVELNDKEIFVNALVPAVNKNDSKELNDSYIEEKSYTNTFKVNRAVKLSTEQYEYFTKNLLDSYEFLAEQGGWSEDDNGNLEHFFGVAIVCEGHETLIIDPSGHDYARYTCRLIKDINNSLENEIGAITTNSDKFEEQVDTIVDTDLYIIEASKEQVETDERIIKNDYLNGVCVVFGSTLKDMIYKGEPIDIYNLKTLDYSLNTFLDGLYKCDNGILLSLTDMMCGGDGVNKIKMLPRYKRELAIANGEEIAL